MDTTETASVPPTTGARPFDERPGNAVVLAPAPPAPAPTIAEDSTARGLAIAALVCGAAGFGPVAIILGHIALARLPAGTEGRGLAIAGLVLGYVTTVGFVIALFIALVTAFLPLLLILGFALVAGSGAT